MPAPEPPLWLRVNAGSVAIRVRARPGASRRGVIRADRDALVMGLNSPPEKGRANRELIELIAAVAGVPRSGLTIVRGAGSRDKLVSIATDDPSSVGARLAAIVEGQAKGQSAPRSRD